jgi:hypothetical protein
MRTQHAGRLLGRLLLAGLCLGLSGCLVIGASTEKKAPPPTLGQELIDLKSARDQGAISEDEYHHTRRNLISPTYRK